MLRILVCGLVLLFATSLYAEKIEIKPFRTVRQTGSLGDIFSHTPDIVQGERNTLYHDVPDLMNAVHETTHVLHARLRIILKADAVFYFMHNTGFKLKNPPITLSEIGRNVPRDKRGPDHYWYLIRASQWYDDNPLYIADELVAYINGTVMGLELGHERDTRHSYKKVLEMWEYTKVAQELSRKKRHSDQKEFDEFMDFVYNKRILWLEQQIKNKQWRLNPPRAIDQHLQDRIRTPDQPRLPWNEMPINSL